ncbi:hypothetical protein FIU83_10795 [Halomonas sp. THAF5a]|nr:hypothetical protein FIU83_10795 [Halomonas sp. THAF5a]
MTVLALQKMICLALVSVAGGWMKVIPGMVLAFPFWGNS